MSKPADHFYEFGPFRIDPVKRLLLRDGEVVPLTPKTFDTLRALVENNERVVEKDELMKEVWADTIVEEGGLTRNISVLRKALGENPDEHQYIVTVPGRGYRFVANVHEARDAIADVIVEEHSRSHLVVEQEEETSAAGKYAAEAEQAIQEKALTASRWEKRASKWRLSTVALAVCLLVVGLAVALSYFWISSRSKHIQAGAAVRSIAVLPFKPLVAEGRDESLEMGMADTLITRLSSISQIVVRPTSSVRKYTGVEQDPIAVGRELMVDSVLDGSIQKSADRIRVTVRLVSVGDGRTLWADKFDENFTDIFRVQDSISERAAGALALKLTGKERKLLAKHYTENSHAYQLYLRGRYFWDKRTDDGFKKAIEYFGQAIAIDPNYALAYTGLADSYVLLGAIAHHLLPPQEKLPEAKAAAAKALEIDDTLSEAHNSLGSISQADWDWLGAEREFKRAIELDPNNVRAHYFYSVYLSWMGRNEEAFAEYERVQQIDPLSLNSGAVLFYHVRQYDQAIEQFQKMLEIDPNRHFTHWQLGMVYEQKRMYKEAIAEEQKAVSLSADRPINVAWLAHAYAVAGNRVEAQKLLDKLKTLAKRRYVSPHDIAIIYIGLGEKDRAFEWLEKAYAEHALLVNLKVDPVYDSLRSDPRFSGLVRRVGLPQ